MCPCMQSDVCGGDATSIASLQTLPPPCPRVCRRYIPVSLPAHGGCAAPPTGHCCPRDPTPPEIAPGLPVPRQSDVATSLNCSLPGVPGPTSPSALHSSAAAALTPPPGPLQNFLLKNLFFMNVLKQMNTTELVDDYYST